VPLRRNRSRSPYAKYSSTGWTNQQAGVGSAADSLVTQATLLYEVQNFAYSLHTLVFAAGAVIGTAAAAVTTEMDCSWSALHCPGMSFDRPPGREDGTGISKAFAERHPYSSVGR